MNYFDYKKRKIAEWEKRFLLKELEKFDKVSDIAKHLNIHVSNFRRLLRIHGIEIDEEKYLHKKKYRQKNQKTQL